MICNFQFVIFNLQGFIKPKVLKARSDAEIGALAVAVPPGADLLPAGFDALYRVAALLPVEAGRGGAAALQSNPSPFMDISRHCSIRFGTGVRQGSGWRCGPPARRSGPGCGRRPRAAPEHGPFRRRCSIAEL